MKETILDTITKLKEQGIDLNETPALFRWTYPEHPELLIEMMISKPEEEDRGDPERGELDSRINAPYPNTIQ